MTAISCSLKTTEEDQNEEEATSSLSLMVAVKEISKNAAMAAGLSEQKATQNAFLSGKDVLALLLTLFGKRTL